MKSPKRRAPTRREAACAENGTDTTLYKACQYNQFCNPVGGDCQTSVCVPGVPGCFGSIKATCKADGSGYDPGSVDCADTGKVCDTGSCVPKVCEAGRQVCVDGGVAWCNYAGSGQSAPNPCYEGSHCDNGQCVYNTCVPGNAACDGNIVSTCNPQGSGALPGNASNDCATQSKVCDEGICKAKVCEPSAFFCGSSNIQHCSSTGASFTLSQYCASETYCKTLTDTTAECRPKLCVKGATGCVGEDFGTCSSDGVTLEPGFGDCDGSGQVCSFQGCAASAVDEIGGTTDVQSLATGSVIFNRVRVLTPRKLTQIAAYLSLPSTRTLRWVVYAPAGWYDWQLIFDQVTTSDGAQFHASTAMDLKLEAEKEYLIGVAVTGGSFVSYLEAPAGQQQLMSFGAGVSSGFTYYATTISYYQPVSYALQAMRLTTALP